MPVAEFYRDRGPDDGLGYEDQVEFETSPERSWTEEIEALFADGASPVPDPFEGIAILRHEDTIYHVAKITRGVIVR